jgi:hypothetical protein
LKPIFKIVLFSALVVLFGVSMFLVLAYPFEPKSPSQTLPTAQGVYDGLQLTMTLEKTEYTLGEPINITLTLTNISNKTVSFWLDYYNDFDFRVYNGTNSTVYSHSNPGGYIEAVPDVIWDVTLNAGKSLSVEFSWQQTWYPNVPVQMEGVPVLPGTYYIVGQVGPIYFRTNSTIETTPIQVTIV